MSSKKLLEKVTARVFCSPNAPRVGGNPVTIFLGDEISKRVQEELSKTCDWESVIACSTSPVATLYFYMPSGEQVSFCAHAAMGAAHILGTASNSSALEFQAAMTQETHKAVLSQANENGTSSTVGLTMETIYEECPITNNDVLTKLLSQIHMTQEHLDDSLPIVNASVARPKTLIPIKSVEAVTSARAPSDPDAFRTACDAIGSTGLYLYTRRVDSQYECRQFPRASGYPEDSATGIAAGALAAHLKQRHTTEQNDEEDIHRDTFDIYQGYAMGKPSLIRIRDVNVSNVRGDSSLMAKFTCWGNVQVDSAEIMELQDDKQ